MKQASRDLAALAVAHGWHLAPDTTPGDDESPGDAGAFLLWAILGSNQ